MPRLLFILLLALVAIPRSADAREPARRDSMRLALPDVVVESKMKKVLHVVAYVREYSTLASYDDTVAMYREKMVDFMIPPAGKTKFKGWDTPRLLNSNSYYHFTSSEGLDSVSDRFNNHFSWSDWVGLPIPSAIPESLADPDTSASDTIFGRYTPAEIWRRDSDRVNIRINILADASSRRWTPTLTSFFARDDSEFQRFTLDLDYRNVLSSTLSPLDLQSYAFEIESEGRGGRGMFKFSRYDQPFFVTTRTEVYVLDRQYLSIRDAKKIERRAITPLDYPIIEPADAPDIQPDALALIARVDNIDLDSLRAYQQLDPRQLANAHRHRRPVQEALHTRVFRFLKTITGASDIISRRNNNRQWREFRREQMRRNDSHSSPRRSDDTDD